MIDPLRVSRGVRIFVALLLMTCSACSMSVRVTPLTGERFPASDAETLPLYNRKPPGNWTEVVRIEIEGTESDDFEDTRERARKEAARLGAEALWIYGEHTESRSAYVPPTSFSWTETRSVGTGRFKVEHTRTTPGRAVRYGVPVCKYVGIRRSAAPAPESRPVPTFACPHCATAWEIPPEDDVYECSCSGYMYLISCPGCRKRFVWRQAGESACPDCRRQFAIVLCPHCRHAAVDGKYAGRHRCDFCRKDYWGMSCPACHKTLVSATPLSSAQCPECDKSFDIPPAE